MDNTKVRSYLRKGELAVALLESLGYSYSERAGKKSEWTAPEHYHAPEILADLQALIDKMTPKPIERVAPVTAGTRFEVNSLPSGHFLEGFLWRKFDFTVIGCTWVEKDTVQSKRAGGFTGWAVNFNYYGSASPTGLWLPLSCITVVKRC